MRLLNQMFASRKYREEEGGEGAGDGTTEIDVVELQKKYEALKSDNERLQAKAAEANKHNKEAERQAKAEAAKRAAAEGNYEQLFKSSETERETLSKQLEELNTKIATKERNNAALKIAGELAEGENIELLAEFIERRLKYTEEGIKIIDGKGNLTISTLDDLKKEFAGSAKYASLIKGRQSSGGGASGGSSGGNAPKSIPRSEFNALDPAGRMKFVKSGGKVSDN